MCGKNDIEKKWTSWRRNEDSTFSIKLKKREEVVG